MNNWYKPAICKETLVSNLEIGKLYKFYNRMSCHAGFTNITKKNKENTTENIEFVKNGSLLTLIKIDYVETIQFNVLIKFTFIFKDMFLVVDLCEIDQHFTFKEIIYDIV